MNLYSQRKSLNNSVGKIDTCHQAKNLIEFNLWSFVPIDNVIFYNVQYLRKITCKNVFGIDFKLPANPNITGFGLGLDYRHYFFNNAFKGGYFNAGLSRVELQGESSMNVKEEIEIYSFNFLFGYTFIFGKHFTFDIGGGITYNTGPDLQETELQTGQSNTLPNFRFAFGWAF
jgi:hypothetical protein